MFTKWLICRENRGFVSSSHTGCCISLPTAPSIYVCVLCPNYAECIQWSRQRTGSQYKCVQNLLRARAANVITQLSRLHGHIDPNVRASAEISGTRIHQTLCFTYNNSEARSKKYHGTMTVYWGVHKLVVSLVPFPSSREFVKTYAIVM